MESVSQRQNKERLRWVEDARQGLLRILEEDMMDPRVVVFPTVDPLKFILKVTLRRPLPKSARQPFRAYIRAWADTTDCEVPIINITERWVQAEVLTKSRVRSRDEKGRFKGKRRFVGGPR